MASAATMQGIWGMLESMPLTARNKRWLADKLIVSIPAKKEKALSKEDQEILVGFRAAVRELKEYKAGRVQFGSMDELLKEIREERKAGVYD